MFKKVILISGSLLTLMVLSIYSKISGKTSFNLSDFTASTVYADVPSSEGTVGEGSSGGEGSAEGSSEGSSGGSCSGGSSG